MSNHDWMRDCAAELERQNRADERLVRCLRYAAVAAVFGLVVGVLCHSCVTGIVRTVELEEEQAQRRWLADTYDRPLAYRLSGPTPEQMDRLEALRVAQRGFPVWYAER